MSRQLLLHTVSQLSLTDLLALHQHVIRAISEKNILSLLPTEIAQQVLFLLDPKDLASAARVCRDWNALVDASTIWQHVASTHAANACVAVEDPYNEAKQRVAQHKRWRSFTPKMAPKKLHFHSTRIVALKNVQWIVSAITGKLTVATVGAVSCMDAQWSLEEQCIWIAPVLVVRVSSKQDSHHKVTKTCTPYQDAYAILVDSDLHLISGSADGVLQTYNFKESQMIATSIDSLKRPTLTKISHLQDSLTILKQEGSIHDRSLILHFSSAPSSPTFSVYSKSFIIMDNMGIGFWEYNQHKRKFVQLSELEGYMIKGMNLRVSDPRACVVGSNLFILGF
ncbi:hypothetical protein BDR26DRAFT_861230 [Obelidium mucronatum]|nr:hypothetical protein BDR26DRAFT_861230 [Obelidium mucronatum]